MPDCYQRAALRGLKFPTDDRFSRRVIVPIRVPCVDEQARRIAFQNLSVTLKLTYVVNHDDSLLGSVAIFATTASVHLPALHRTLRVGEPPLQFACISESLKYTFRRSSDVNLADHGVLVGGNSNDCCVHSAISRHPKLRSFLEMKRARYKSCPFQLLSTIPCDEGRRIPSSLSRGPRTSSLPCDGFHRERSAPFFACAQRRAQPGSSSLRK